MTKKRFETTIGVGEKVLNGMTKGAIKFGKELSKETDKLITREWKSEKLDNGTVVSLHFSHKQGEHPVAGKKFNPKYQIAITDKDKHEQRFSGKYVRKIFDRVTLGAPKKRTTVLTEDVADFCENALSDI